MRIECPNLSLWALLRDELLLFRRMTSRRPALSADHCLPDSCSCGRGKADERDISKKKDMKEVIRSVAAVVGAWETVLASEPFSDLNHSAALGYYAAFSQLTFTHSDPVSLISPPPHRLAAPISLVDNLLSFIESVSPALGSVHKSGIHAQRRLPRWRAQSTTPLSTPSSS